MSHQADKSHSALPDSEHARRGTNRQLVLSRRPEGALDQRCFRLREAAIARPSAGEVLTRTLYLSIDPAGRIWINEQPSYRPAVALGAVMPGFAVSVVVESRDPRFAPGDLVHGDTGWQDFSCGSGERLHPVDPALPGPLSYHCSVYGVTGLTAYFGLFDVGAPRPGETVLVSAAAGAVGSIAGQLATIYGCRAVGIAGGPAKCQRLVDELGFAAAIDRKALEPADLWASSRAIAERCPGGINLYFDNVGGPLLDAALLNMATRGRVVCCGAVSMYDGVAPGAGVRAVPGFVISKRLRLEGFLVMDFYDRREVATTCLGRAVASGELKVLEDIIDGLEQAPRALVEQLSGANIGKRMIRVDPAL